MNNTKLIVFSLVGGYGKWGQMWEDWEVNTIGVHDVRFLNNQLKNLKKKHFEGLGDGSEGKSTC